MKCYYFCQQCEDYFEITGTKNYKRVPFIASFLKDGILFCWQQHKNRIKWDRAALPNWEKFKAFLHNSLGESTAFVDNIWSKIKRNSQYQLKEVQDWSADLEHFQLIMMEFDANYTLSETLLGR